MGFKCKECDKNFTAKRSDAEFCSTSCRVNFKKKKDRLLVNVNVFETEIHQCAEEIDTLEYHMSIFSQAEAFLATMQGKVEENRSKFRAEIRSMEKGNSDLLKQSIDLFDIKNSNGPFWSKALGGMGGLYSAKNLLQIEEKKKKREAFYGQEVGIYQAKRNEFVGKIKEAKVKRDALKIKEAQLRQQIELYKDNHAKYLRPERKNNDIQKFMEALPEPILGTSAQDILTMRFDTFRLEGNLGKFLGELDRKMLAVGLVGDPGAGKSSFSLAIAQLFDKVGMRVAYFSLEMGIGEVFKQNLLRHPLSSNVQIFDRGTLADIRTKAVGYDCIFIDSFGKTGGRAEDIDRLRNEFPDKIFLFIFQKTTKGTSRGGAAVDYDCSMLIDVIKENGQRVAIMQKSRYGTQGERYMIPNSFAIK